MKNQHAEAFEKHNGPRLRYSTLAPLVLALAVAATTTTAFGQGLKITKLNPAGATSAVGIGLNTTNQVVGNYKTSTGVIKGFEYLGGTRYKNIAFPTAKNFTRA